MSGFSDTWLALREPADSAARARGSLERFLPAQAAGTPLRVLDLGAGSGANFRFLAPRLGAGQRWLLIDHDTALLAAVPARLAAWGAEVGVQVSPAGAGWQVRGANFDAWLSTEQIDLSQQFGALRFDQTDLVTGSALLDLVSADWLAQLADACAGQRCAAMFALSYNGQIAWQPPLALDAQVVAALNAHQRGVKSFGAALGPSAVGAFVERFAAHGFRVEQADTPWVLDDGWQPLQQALLQGWMDAAAEMDAALAAGLPVWLRERLQLAARPGNGLRVGHTDLLALPPAL